MTLYPETQARAHTKPDAVVGRARQPTFANCPHQPYIRAMVTAKKYYVGDPTPTARMRRILTRRNISSRMSLRDITASGGESGIKEDRDGHVLAIKYALVATCRTNRSSSMSLSCHGQPKIERKKDVSSLGRGWVCG